MPGMFFVWSDNFQIWSDIVQCPTVILRPEEEKHAVVQILHPSLFVSDIKAKKYYNRKNWKELKN